MIVFLLMKLHLPVSLRKSLLAVFIGSLAVTSHSAYAGIMHSDATIATYTDFGQNKGRFVVGSSVNSLMQHIRDTEGGIGIEYTDGTPTYYLSNQQGMINFSGVHDGGHSALVSVNMLATVKHNGSLSASFAANDIGNEHAQKYSVLDIRGSDKFRLTEASGYDYMLQRQTRIVTDAVMAPVSTVDITTLTGKHMYHSGAGIMGMYHEDTDTWQSLAWAYAFNIGDIDQLTGVNYDATNKRFAVYKDVGYGNGIGASLENPLPNATRGGDSGSPVFIYNSLTGQYEYIASHQAGNGRSWGQALGNLEWTHAAVKTFDVSVDMADTNEVHLGAVTTPAGSVTDNMGNTGSLYTGTVFVGGGNALSFNGVRDGELTWRDMRDIKDEQTWYAYDAGLYHSEDNADGKLNQKVADLYYTQNLVFTSTSAENTIVLDATVDMGAGYMEFNKSSLSSTKYTITGEGKQLHTSGYVINEGVEVHLQLTNPEDYMTEWRKTGAGDLYIDGTGDTNAMLNVGGTGKTYLQQKDGYAAYNVLVNTGATVVISDINQIKRDFTFGAEGGTLDMNGNSMAWYTSADAAREGFSINALTEGAIITNSSETSVLLTYMESGDTVYKGSFTDTEKGALSIDYQGGGSWTLNGIHTNLQNNAGSGLSVSNGKVVLVGTNTLHGQGSFNGYNQNRYTNALDWHYADAKMDVTVKDGGTFELGSHARLEGDVAVQGGGTFIMHEGVQHAQEYIEGGTFLQSTADISAFYGLKGNVSLDAGASMRVEYSQDATMVNTYAGNISGAGSLTVVLGAADKKFILSGDNSGHTGAKELVSGYLVAETLKSLGDTSSNTWKMTGVDAVLSAHEGTAEDLLARVHGDSVGTLALSGNTEGALDLSGHKGLFIGAEEGKAVHYGQSGASLAAVDGKWQFGGGGGELYVDFKLSGANNLVLGVSQTASGTVVLNNGANDFSGDITFSGKGLILKSVAGGLGRAKLDLNYGNALGASSTDVITNKNLKDGSNGILLVNDLDNADVDLSAYAGLALGAQNEASYSGNITLAEGEDYHFSSAAGGSLTVLTALDSSRNIVVDGQGLTGGKVVLNGNASLNGDLVVRGNAVADSHGDMTFALGRNLATTGAVTVENGGVIDLAGYNLSIAGSLSGTGGSIIDSSGHAELSFAADAADVSSAAYMDLATVRKTGSRNFTLTNDNVNIDNLYVEEGSVTMGSGTRSMTVHLADGTHVDVGTHTAQFDLNMAFNGGEAELKHTGNTGKVTLDGNITLGSGSQLNLHGGTGVTYALNGASYGGGNAVLSVNADKVEFNTQSTTILGTLRAENNLEIYSNANGELERSIAQLDIANNSQVMLNERTWKTIWNIDSLTGEGELYWKSNTTHDYTSRLILKGDGGFSGTISLDRDRTDKANRTHGAFIELASDTAAKNAVISLSGTHANSVASLAVNTHNATIKGLVGNEHSYVYAGESMDAAELSGTARPTATRNATLVVNVDSGKEYTYAGALGCTADTASAGLNLVKTGAGVQNLTGAIATNNLTVQQGTLNISQAPVRGNLAIGLGATLNAGNNLELGSGQRLSVAAGVDGATGSAVLGSSLSLNGGSLGFDGGAVVAANAAGNAALSLQGITLNGTANINFTNYTALSAGETYTLATGDWSGLTSSLTSSGLGYYAASFSTNASGHLQMSLTTGGTAILWKGTAENYAWTKNNFGPGNGATTSSSVVVFEDSAENKTVNMTTTQVTVSEIIFNNTETYTVKRGATGSMIGATAGNLSVVNTGEVIIEDCITVTGKTVVDNGTLTWKIAGLMQYDTSGWGDIVRSEVSGTGTLKIDWGTKKFDTWYTDDQIFGLIVNGLRTLHIANGKLGATDGTAMLVENVILDSAGTYVQGNGVDQTTNFVVNGGIMNLGSGSLNGTLTQNGDARIEVREKGDAYLNSRLTQNGHQLTQIGSGTLHIGADSAAVLQNYKISSGTLRYDSGAMSEGNGTLEVAGGTLHVQNGAGLEASLIKVSGGKLQVDSGASLMGNTALHLSNAAATATLESYNSYTGGTTIDAGTLEVTANGGLGTGAVAINGGSLVVGAAARGALSSISGLSLNGGTLDLSAIQFNAYDAMELNGAFSVSGGTINLGSSLSATGTSYAIFDIGNATFDWSLDALAENLMVNGTLLSGYKDVTLGVNDGLATITFGSFDLSNIIINSGETHSMTESELKEFGGSITINEGGTLAMTERNTEDNKTSTAFNKVSGAGNVELTLNTGGNGTGYDLSTISGDVVVADGRLQVNTSTFNEASTIVLKESTSQLIFNGTGSLNNDVVLDAATTIYVNNNTNGKSGTISGSLSGKALTKQGGGTLTLSGNSSIEWLTVLAGSVKIDGTLNLTAQQSGAVAVTGITGAGTLGLNFTGDYANTLSVASGFTGTTHLQSGKFTFKDAAFGGSLRMTGGTGIQATADTTVAGSLAMDGAAEVVVADGKTLQVNGAMSGASATLTKDGTGALVLNGGVNIGTLKTKAGEFVVRGTANTINMIDASMSANAARGTVLVDENASLKVTGQVWGHANSAYKLASGAQFDISADKVVISNKGTETASLIASGTTSGTEYSKDNANYELTNGHLAYTGTDNQTLTNKLTNSSVENAGGATLTVSNSANTLTGVVAGKGNVTLHHMGAAMSLDLLEIAAGKTVNAYVGTDAAEKTTTTTVTGSALLSGTATLNTSLTLADGATLDMTGLEAGAVTLSGALTFGGQVELGETLLASVESLGYGEMLNLFTGVSAVTVGTDELGSAQVQAGTVFSNVDNANVYVEFRMSGDVGSLLVVNIPEPTTSTLSLLALAALAARRRRK